MLENSISKFNDQDNNSNYNNDHKSYNSVKKNSMNDFSSPSIFFSNNDCLETKYFKSQKTFNSSNIYRENEFEKSSIGFEKPYQIFKITKILSRRKKRNIFSNKQLKNNISSSNCLKESKKMNTWNKKEDALLLELKNINYTWSEISKIITSKSKYQCYSRYRRIQPNLSRGKWTSEEDKSILNGYEMYGKNWALISKFCEIKRNSKQIRDRFINVLDSNLNKSSFKEIEDDIIYFLKNKLGPKWVKIASILINRSPNKVKNHYEKFLKKRDSHFMTRQIEIEKYLKVFHDININSDSKSINDKLNKLLPINLYESIRENVKLNNFSKILEEIFS